MTHNGREVLTIDQARARVGVSRRTIYNWLRRGQIEDVRTARGLRRIYADTLFCTPDSSDAGRAGRPHESA
jgi:excisionase family DNA binding protein